jgi:hypothetical protein
LSIKQAFLILCVLSDILFTGGCQSRRNPDLVPATTEPAITQKSPSDPLSSGVMIVTFTPGPSPTNENTQAASTPSTDSTSIPPILYDIVDPTAEPTTGDQKLGLLDLSDPDSIASWFAYGVHNADIDVFSEIIYHDSVMYGSGLGITGSAEMSRENFISLLSDRIQSKPMCAGYTKNKNSVTIFTTGWSPVWQEPNKATSRELVFTFPVPAVSEMFVSATFLPSAEILKSIDHLPCPNMDGKVKP